MSRKPRVPNYMSLRHHKVALVADGQVVGAGKSTNSMLKRAPHNVFAKNAKKVSLWSVWGGQIQEKIGDVKLPKKNPEKMSTADAIKKVRKLKAGAYIYGKDDTGKKVVYFRKVGKKWMDADGLPKSAAAIGGLMAQRSEWPEGRLYAAQGKANPRRRNPSMRQSEIEDELMKMLIGDTRVIRGPKGKAYTNWSQYFGVGPKQIEQALASLVRKGRLKKTRRGWERVASNPRKTRKAAGARIDNSLKRKINARMRRLGLDGNGRFRKPDRGFAAAVDAMQEHGVTLDGVVDAFAFSARPNGTVRADIAFIDDSQPFAPGITISNSILYLRYTEVSEDRFEVVAYLS